MVECPNKLAASHVLSAQQTLHVGQRHGDMIDIPLINQLAKVITVAYLVRFHQLLLQVLLPILLFIS